MIAVDEYRSWCREHVRESPGFDLADAAIAALEAKLDRKELVCTRLRTSRREETAECGRMDDALHSAFDDYRVDFPDSRIDDYDGWLALHVTCGKEMRAPSW